MRMSTKGRYALRAIVEISLAEGEAVSVAQIAQTHDLSRGYLEQLIQKLRRAGLVQSIQGARGGYILARRPEDISVADVLNAAGEPMDVVECMGADWICPGADTCRTKKAWQTINDGIRSITQTITIASLLSDAPTGTEEASKHG